MNVPVGYSHVGDRCVVVVKAIQLNGTYSRRDVGYSMVNGRL